MAKAPTADDKPVAGPKNLPGVPLPGYLIHPDPEGKMRSYAPGYGPGPDGEPVEVPGTESTITIGSIVSNPVHLPQRSE